MLFLSPRNSLDGQINLLEKTQCNIFLHSKSHSSTIEPIFQARAMRTFVVPELSDVLLDTNRAPHYPYDKTFEEAQDEPYAILHTSGSTGLPKPILLKHSTVATLDAQFTLPTLDGREAMINFMRRTQRLYFSMPPFHAAGLFITVLISICGGATIVFGPADRPVNLDTILEVLDTSNGDSAFIAPSTLEEISKSPEALKCLEKLRYVCYSGGPVMRDAGNILSKLVEVIQVLGTTEVGLLASYKGDRNDWEYFNYSPKYNGMEWRPTSDPEVFEQFIVRDDRISEFQGVFKTFPDLKEYATKDLYRKHSTKADYWLYQGRADDIIVFSNGEKLNPLSVEEIITRHPKVAATLVLGQERFQPAALIELRQPAVTNEEKARLLEEIWPLVVHGNKESPSHAQIQKSHIMFSNPEKPFLKTSKGTIRRQVTVQLYDSEIETLYQEAEAVSLNEIPELATSSQASLATSLQDVFAHVAGIPKIEKDMDIFAAGIDSLRIMTLARALKAKLGTNAGERDLESITPRLIYSNPTISSLAAALFAIIHRNASGPMAEESRRLQAMKDMVQKYTVDLPSSLPSRRKGSKGSDTDRVSVILTGSTGALGSYLLDILLAKPKIFRIYCLNRAVDGQKRQTSVSNSKSLSTDWFRKDVRFLCADLSKPLLGLEKHEYLEMARDASYIIHNQWQVDFNLTLPSFEPQVRAVRNLVDFSAQSANRAPIFFISSISTVQGWTQSSKVPETSLDDLTLAIGGYGQSKLVASVILEKAARLSGIRHSVCRLSQVAGPVEKGGEWNRHEWLPSIVASSKYLGVLPENLGTMDIVDWVPVDYCARIVTELADASGDTKNSAAANYYHLANPRHAKWSDLVTSILEHISGLKTVSFEDWVRALRQSSEKTEDFSRNPGVKLLEFYEGMAEAERPYVKLDTKETCKQSKTMQGLSPVDKKYVRIWLEQWSF
jgi:thioester reductase-like protein